MEIVKNETFENRSYLWGPKANLFERFLASIRWWYDNDCSFCEKSLKLVIDKNYGMVRRD